MIDVTNFGLAAATLTPFAEDGRIDVALLKAHCDWLADNGCDLISLFGTTGEGPSIAHSERQRTIDYLAAHRFDFSKCVMGVSGAAGGDVRQQIEQAHAAGCTSFLMPPPFYYKGVSQDAVANWFAPVLRRMAELQCQAILYHIPQVTAVDISVGLLRRLLQDFPDVVVAVKDSQGDPRVTKEFLGLHQIAVLVGDERHLGNACAEGAVGSISGLANLLPGRLKQMIDSATQDLGVSALVDEIVRHPVTPAVKTLLAHRSGNPHWLRVSPPFEPLTAVAAKSVIDCFQIQTQQSQPEASAHRAGAGAA